MLFLQIMFTEFIAEMGDKTQLMLIAMASKFRIRDIILGTAAAILVLNGVAVLAGGIVGELIPDWLIKLIAAAAFLYFSATSLAVDDEEEETGGERGRFAFAPLTVFCTFFIAELGDKTQLTAITFGANEGLSRAIIVWLACSVGLFAADIIGMLAGYFLKSKMPEGFLDKLAFAIFAVYGILTLRQGLFLLLGEESAIVLPVMAVVLMAFAAISVMIYRKGKKTA